MLRQDQLSAAGFPKGARPPNHGQPGSVNGPDIIKVAHATCLPSSFRPPTRHGADQPVDFFLFFSHLSALSSNLSRLALLSVTDVRVRSFFRPMSVPAQRRYQSSAPGVSPTHHVDAAHDSGSDSDSDSGLPGGPRGTRRQRHRLLRDFEPPETRYPGRSHHADDTPAAESISSSQKVVGWRDLPKKKQLFVITMARLSEPLVQTSLQSYMFYQLKWFDPDLSDAVISGQAGVLHASFMATQFLTAMVWGRVADSSRAGRKTVILIGLLGTCKSLPSWKIAADCALPLLSL